MLELNHAIHVGFAISELSCTVSNFYYNTKLLSIISKPCVCQALKYHVHKKNSENNICAERRYS